MDRRHKNQIITHLKMGNTIYDKRHNLDIYTVSGGLSEH